MDVPPDKQLEDCPDEVSIAEHSLKVRHPEKRAAEQANIPEDSRRAVIGTLSPISQLSTDFGHSDFRDGMYFRDGMLGLARQRNCGGLLNKRERARIGSVSGVAFACGQHARSLCTLLTVRRAEQYSARQWRGNTANHGELSTVCRRRPKSK